MKLYASIIRNSETFNLNLNYIFIQMWVFSIVLSAYVIFDSSGKKALDIIRANVA